MTTFWYPALLYNCLVLGATRQGKSKAGAKDALAFPGAVVVIDPHRDSLARDVLTHASGEVLYDRLSELRHVLGYDFLSPSDDPDPLVREAEDELKTQAFVSVLCRKRNGEPLGSLTDEWVTALVGLYLAQSVRKPLTILPYGFLPETDEFRSLLRDCTRSDLKAKFSRLEGMNLRALRAEVGPAERLVNRVFRSPYFRARCVPSFDLGAFLDRGGKLILERGDVIGDDTSRFLLGAIILLVMDHAKRRTGPRTPIMLMVDEASNSGLCGETEQLGARETLKENLCWRFLVQDDNVPGGIGGLLQNCLRREYFGCPFHDLARKAATDILAGLPAGGEESRAERLDKLTTDLMTLPVGWRWVRDPKGSRREYVPLLENPWPDWPGLREAKLREKVQWLYEHRPEYQTPATPPPGGGGPPPSSPSSPSSPPPPSSSPGGSSASPAERLKARRGGPPGGSSGSGSDVGSG